MRATEFEFRYRSLIVLSVYFIGLSFYGFDHANVVSSVIAHTVGRGAPNANFLAHALFGIGALLVFLAAALRTWAAAHLQSNTVQDPAMHLDSIVADGPYRHLRNPLYLGRDPPGVRHRPARQLDGLFIHHDRLNDHLPPPHGA